MNASEAHLRRERARLREYLKNRAGLMSQDEAYERSWPRYRRAEPRRTEGWPQKKEKE